MKPCYVCAVEKPLGEFYAHPDTLDGTTNICKECHKAGVKRNKEANEEYYLAYDRQRYHDNGHRYKNYEPSEYLKAWRKSTGKMVEYANNRRALKLNAEGTFSTEEFIQLCDYHEWVCLWCEYRFDKLSADHVVPLSKGGSNHIANIQPLCGPCNSSKGVKIMDFRQTMTREE